MWLYFMFMFRSLKKKYKDFGITKSVRIERYLENIESKFELRNQKDKDIVNDLNKLIVDRLNRVKKVYNIELFLYAGAYFSFFSYFFSDYLVLVAINEIISIIVGFFGTTIFLIALFFTSRLKELYYQDLNLMTAHVVSIYTKNKFTEDNLFDESNTYNAFINFFKKRGF